MAAMTNFLENKLVDALFRNVSYTPPTTLYVALYTVVPTSAGGGTEVTGGSYARTTLAASATNWASTGGAGTTTNPSAGTTGATSNNAAITFPAPTANWGTVVAFAIFDALAGNMLIFGNLTSSKTVNNGDAAPSFAAGSLVVTLS